MSTPRAHSKMGALQPHYYYHYYYLDRWQTKVPDCPNDDLYQWVDQGLKSGIWVSSAQQLTPQSQAEDVLPVVHRLAHLLQVYTSFCYHRCGFIDRE